MVKERNKAIPAVYLVLRREEKILWMRRFNTGYSDGEYGLPSGHVEKEEFPVDALVREAKEEVGIDVDRESIRFLHCTYRVFSDEQDRIDLFFETSYWAGEPENMEPCKCDEMGWFLESEPPEAGMRYIKAAIKLGSHGISYSEQR